MKLKRFIQKGPISSVLLFAASDSLSTSPNSMLGNPYKLHEKIRMAMSSLVRPRRDTWKRTQDVSELSRGCLELSGVTRQPFSRTAAGAASGSQAQVTTLPGTPEPRPLLKLSVTAQLSSAVVYDAIFKTLLTEAAWINAFFKRALESHNVQIITF